MLLRVAVLFIPCLDIKCDLLFLRVPPLTIFQLVNSLAQLLKVTRMVAL